MSMMYFEHESSDLHHDNGSDLATIMFGPDAEWNHETYSPIQGKEERIGQRRIDGTMHNVYRCQDGKYRAVLTMHTW